jgi:hypothetical protein
MPAIIDPQTLYVDDLPGIWSPVQWELSPEDRNQELEDQATASLLWSSDAPEAILRLLLNETRIDRAFEPPKGYNPEQQGSWDSSLVTFQFKRSLRLEKVVREPEYIYIEYSFGELGVWSFEITPEQVNIHRI